jgi:hypothetical protein
MERETKEKTVVPRYENREILFQLSLIIRSRCAHFQMKRLVWQISADGNLFAWTLLHSVYGTVRVQTSFSVTI